MKNPLLKKILPHLIAVLIFLVISLVFCKPVLDGNVLNQGDIVGWKGMAQNAFEYKDKNGHFPLWNPNLFSGMPNYQVAIEGKSVLPDMTKVFTLGLPKPVNFFFLASICFYFLCLALGVRTIVAVFGSICFALATYNPVIIGAGHESKMLAIAYAPALLAGLILIYEKKYWVGVALTAMFTCTEVGVNHPQINFYLLLVAVAITIAYAVKWIKEKDWKQLGIAAALAGGSALIGVAGSAVSLMTSYEYTKATMRGGKSIAIEGDTVKAAKTSGLDTSYAFQYSLGKTEAAVILMPDAFGGSSAKTFDENSKVVKKLADRGINEGSAVQLASSLPKYWGGIDGVGTAGPPYLGVITCLLALIGFILYKKPLRWGLLAVTVFGILMAWGKYLPGFNNFLFHNLPLYNKFRAPSMAMVITQFTIPLVAVLAMQYLLFRDKSRELLKADFRKIMYAVGGLLALLTLMYVAMDYGSWMDKQLLANKWDNSGTDEIGRLIVSGLKADRQSMFGGQLLRTFGFAIFTLGVLYMHIRNVLKPMVVALLITAVSTIDLFATGKEYLNEDHYVPKDELETQSFGKTPVDEQILADKDPNFRVFNTTAGPFMESRTSYYFKSIGGYHPAKLRIYQDIIEKYLSGPFNPGVLNMLNAKYLVVPDPQTNRPTVIPNTEAFGNCWLVRNVKIVPGPVEEIQAIGNLNLKDTAVVQQSFSAAVTQPQRDSASSVKMTKFDNDAIEYEANCNGPQFAVFSEIYYPFGWNAYIDGKKTEYVKANYALRGLSIPAGKHAIKFVFEPSSYKNGKNIGFIASFLILILFAGGLFMGWRESRKKEG